jgi:hypothetical protein
MTQFDDIIITPVIGPLTTDNYPFVMPYHNYGSLPGKHPNPPFFFPSQEPLYSDQNSNSRQQYLRTALSNKVLWKQREETVLNSTPSQYFSYSNRKGSAVSSHMNYIAPIQSSMYITSKKANAIGKSGFKVGLPNSAFYTTKNYYPSGVRTSLQRARSGGCTAPKKKGSIYNTSLRNGQVCAWGSLPRQNY